MPADFNHIRYLMPKFHRGSIAALMKTLNNLYGFETSDVAKFRLKVLDHYYKFGWQSTVDAFKIGKSTLYDWKKAFERSHKNLSSLVPRSTAPKRVRMMRTDPRVLELITSLRDEEYRMSKYQLKPLVDAWCLKFEIPLLSVSVIGKIIKRHHLFPKGKRKTKTNHSPKSYVKKSPKETEPRYLQMDSIHLWLTGRKYYFLTIIDVVTKVAFCKLTTSLSSRQARKALEEFQTSYPVIRIVQTDNGHEFLGEFDQYLQTQGIVHKFSYPRSPRINGVVERFNRTFKEEFLHYNDDYADNMELFNQKLTRYLAWYNQGRPHQALKYQTPQSYLQQLLNN